MANQEDKVFIIRDGDIIRGVTSTRELAEKITNMFAHFGLSIEEYEVLS